MHEAGAGGKGPVGEDLHSSAAQPCIALARAYALLNQRFQGTDGHDLVDAKGQFAAFVQVGKCVPGIHSVDVVDGGDALGGECAEGCREVGCQVFPGHVLQHAAGPEARGFQQDAGRRSRSVAHDGAAAGIRRCRIDAQVVQGGGIQPVGMQVRMVQCRGVRAGDGIKFPQVGKFGVASRSGGSSVRRKSSWCCRADRALRPGRRQRDGFGGGGGRGQIHFGPAQGQLGGVDVAVGQSRHGVCPGEVDAFGVRGEFAGLGNGTEEVNASFRRHER